MNAQEAPGQRRRRSARRGQGPGAGKGSGAGRECGASRGAGGRSRSYSDDSSLRTASRRLVIATLAAIADDVRDPDGLVRPTLRRAAQRLCVSPVRPASRLGSAYLRLDPPATPAVEPGPTTGRTGEVTFDAEVVDAEAVEIREDEPDDKARSGAG